MPRKVNTPLIKIHQPPRPHSQQGTLERRGTLNSLCQIRRIWQQMVPSPETSPRQVHIHPFRTQTKIKNYFYGNIRYLLKIIVKYFFKKSTGFINDIKTETLLDMYEGKNCIFLLIQASKTTSSSIKLSKDLGIGWRRSSVKSLSRKAKTTFITLPRSF